MGEALPKNRQRLLKLVQCRPKRRVIVEALPKNRQRLLKLSATGKPAWFVYRSSTQESPEITETGTNQQFMGKATSEALPKNRQRLLKQHRLIGSLSINSEALPKNRQRLLKLQSR